MSPNFKNIIIEHNVITIPSSNKGKTKNNDIEEDRPITHFSNFEDVLNALGGFGPFQMFIIVLLLILEIPTAFVTFIPIFTGKIPELWNCGNETLPIEDVCGCNGSMSPADPSLLEESIVAQWGLICEKEWVFDFITSVQMLGMFFGSIYGSKLADWHGRRSGFLGAVLLLSLGSLISALAFNPYIFALSRFICGAGITTFVNVTLVAVVEMMPPRYRSFANCIGPTGEGIMILALMAYYIRPWRILYYATIAPFALIFIIFPFVPESPRWLLKEKRTLEAHAILLKIARMNSSSPISLESLQHLVDKEEIKSLEKSSAAAALDSQSGNGKRFGYLDFIRDPQLRLTSLLNLAMWFTWALTYYGISFNIRNLDGDIYLNVFLMGASNALGQRAALLMNNRFGRRKALCSSMSFCAISLTSLALYLMIVDVEDPMVVVSLCLLGQMGMASARSAARLISGESFPTAVRTMGMGLGGITANIAAILTPQLAYLGSRWPSIPFFIFALVSVGGSCISFLMTETKDRPLDGSSPSSSIEEDEKSSDKAFEDKKIIYSSPYIIPYSYNEQVYKNNLSNYSIKLHSSSEVIRNC